jgi:hypothetical protein
LVLVVSLEKVKTNRALPLPSGISSHTKETLIEQFTSMKQLLRVMGRCYLIRDVWDKMKCPLGEPSWSHLFFASFAVCLPNLPFTIRSNQQLQDPCLSVILFLNNYYRCIFTLVWVFHLRALSCQILKLLLASFHQNDVSTS